MDRWRPTRGRSGDAVTDSAGPSTGTTYRVRHRTAYMYEPPVELGYSQAMLLVRACPGQDVESSTLRVTPQPSDLHTHIDAFGNLVSTFSLDQPHALLEVVATSQVRVAPRPVPVTDRTWEASRPRGLECELSLPSPLVPALSELADYAAPSFPPERPVVEAVLDLSHRIHDDFAFDPGFTTVATPISEVLDHQRGVCQDFAHLLLGGLRAVGLAARYVSGYLETDPPPGQARLVGADASHAWCSVWIPEHGWLDLDPTNDHVPGDRHITVAWGRDYGDVTPLKGVIIAGGSGHHLQVEVDVTRVD